MKNKKLGCAIFPIAVFLLFFILVWVTCGSLLDEAIEAIPEQSDALEDAYQEHLDSIE